MKLFKFFIFICVAAVFTASLSGCDRRPKAEKEAEKRAEAALPKVSPPSQVKTDNAVIHAGTCSADSDCVAVFPSCCGEANPPYYINKLYKEDFVSDYRKIKKEPPKKEILNNSSQKPELKNFFNPFFNKLIFPFSKTKGILISIAQTPFFS